TEPRGLSRRNFAFADFSNFEKIEKISGRALADLFHRQAAQFTKLARRLFYKGRFVAFAAMRNGRRIRRIRLDEHAVKRNFQRSIADGLRLGERDVTSKRDQEASIQPAFGLDPVAGKAV